MKKRLLLYIPLLIFIMAHPSFAQHYSKDFLEQGNPGGWSSSLKTWDEEWTLDVGEEIYLDIWISIDCSLITGGLWIVFDPANVSLLDVQVYDGNELSGPWDSGFTTEVTDPDGPGTYMVVVANFSPVQPDQDGDIILGRVHLRYEGGEETPITISTLPSFTTFTCDDHWIPPFIFPNTITLHQRECIADEDCDDGLWCTENDFCNNGVCRHVNRDCSGTADQCNDGVCNESLNSCVTEQKPDGTFCDDGFFCNGDDSCGGGSCAVHTGDPCTFCSSYGCSCDEFRNFCVGCNGDSECDGICSPGETGPFCSGSDNCTYTPNGPDLGSCTTGVSTLFDRDVCTTHGECGTDGYCSMAQEDSYPPQTNGLGDACDCEGDFDCDGDCDGTDAAKFKTDFGRSGFNRPCINNEPCNGDFECDVDVDGTDAALFKSDFGRSSFLNPCPACELGAWCSYPMVFLSEKIEIAANPNLAEWIPRIAYNSLDDEFLVVWTEQGVREPEGPSLYGIVAQRFSSRGEKIASSFNPAGDPVGKIILLPTPSHDMSTNEYLIAYTMSGVGFDQFGAIINNTGTIMKQSFPISEKPRSQMHSSVAFNTVDKQFFVVYNSSESGSPDIKGVILDANGTPVTDELMINDTEGDQYNPYIVYNPTDNTYLINWEDFRNVSTWQENGEIYGALLDSDGSVLVNDIAMIDDFGEPDEGDQRHNQIAYNEDENEFFVCWSDMAPSMNNVGIRGRMIVSDGTLKGPIFMVEDTPAPQMYPHPIYVPMKKQYFILWEDGRNVGDQNTFWRDIYEIEIDIYGKWMSQNGTLFSDEIVFCEEPGVQRYSSISYAADTDRMLIAWQDVVDEDQVGEQGGNIYAIAYGTP